MSNLIVLVGQNVSNVEVEIKKKICGWFGTKNFSPLTGNQFLLNGTIDNADRRYIESCLPQGVKAIYIANNNEEKK